MTTKYNIIHILIDDMGWKDLGCYGSTFYETPHIDQLAAKGMRFTDAYAAAPVCSPTRASLMSGKYPANVGVTDWIGAHTKGKLIDAPYIDHLPLEETSVASALKDGGYATWNVGKWHLGKSPYYPEHHGFDVNIGGGHIGHPYNGYFSPYRIEGLEDGPEGEYLTDRLTDEAIRLIEQKDDKPFFLNLSHYTVHTPVQAKQEDIERFEHKARELGLPTAWEDVVEEGEHFPADNKKHLRVQRRRIQSDPAYAAMIYNLDHNIGRLVSALEKANLTEETVIVFSSDNGGLSTSEGSPTSNAPLHEGKGWMYEGGVRIPLIVKWPGVVDANSVSEEPVTSPDFYPTFLQMANLPLLPEQHVDGVSLVPILQGGETLEREAIYWHYPHYGNQGGTPGSSIRFGNYKLIEFFEDGRVELYHLKNDVEEQHDLSGELPELADEMKAKLTSWRESIEAKIPQENQDDER
ncbi:sulfatase [Bacillaceae bacterium SIJ1]|uniref:sulfatase n=1 Tax=Litoribacterium kuwaitense TaxID=1398745 RepID=UPI0013EC8909|nr:sulfatase [Litoribacterium kuwaitense]NGP46220.1 sulfatase [Litoribacterium kuwaitense]